MVKFGGFAGEKGERRVLGIGLSRRNCEKLLDGEPIAFKGEELGIDNVEVVIVGGENERSIVRDLKAGCLQHGVSLRPLSAMFDDDLEAQ